MQKLCFKIIKEEKYQAENKILLLNAVPDSAQLNSALSGIALSLVTLLPFIGSAYLCNSAMYERLQSLLYLYFIRKFEALLVSYSGPRRV